MCGAVLRCAIISLSNFLFSIAWLIWLQRLGHNYSTFYSHSVFHQSYFLDYFDSGTIIIWNSLKNDMDEVNLSVYLFTYLQLSIRMLKVRMEIFWWRYPQSGSDGRCGAVKATTAERWRRVCILYANTLSHGHGQTSATVDIRQRETTTWKKHINICIVLV